MSSNEREGAAPAKATRRTYSQHNVWLVTAFLLGLIGGCYWLYRIVAAAQY